MWYEEDDGARIIVGVVEGYNRPTDKPVATYHMPNYVILIANTDILDFINRNIEKSNKNIIE